MGRMVNTPSLAWLACTALVPSAGGSANPGGRRRPMRLLMESDCGLHFSGLRPARHNYTLIFKYTHQPPVHQILGTNQLGRARMR